MSDNPKIQNAPILLMVSGGADSTLLLLRAVSGQVDLHDGQGMRALKKNRLAVLHVNHNIRPGSADKDQAFVEQLCQRYGVPCYVRSVDVPALAKERKDNLEKVAREVRYALADELLDELCSKTGVPAEEGTLLVAHTLSDRVETFLMRIIDGSSTTGLGSIPVKRGRIVRPLISLTRDEVEEELNSRSQEWRKDESNADTTLLRSYVRHNVVPVMAEKNPRFFEAVERTMDNLVRDDDYLQRVSQEAMRDAARPAPDGSVVLNAAVLEALDPAIRNRVLMSIVSDFSNDEVRIEAVQISRVVAAIQAGGSLSLPGGVSLSVEGGVPRLLSGENTGQPTFKPQLLEPATNLDLGISGSVSLSSVVEVPADADALEIAQKLKSGDSKPSDESFSHNVDAIEIIDITSLIDDDNDFALQVVPARSGMRIAPLGMDGNTKLVSDVLMEAKVPRYARSHVPVVTTKDGETVWVAPFKLSDAFRVCSSSRFLVLLGFRRSKNGYIPTT